MRLGSSVAVLAAIVAQAQAQYLINDLSFGYGVRYAFVGQQCHFLGGFSKLIANAVSYTHLTLPTKA